ncbi:MAG: hypothetical protein HZB38_11940 [Planctomycetes bacterium]|nr:hypothetical protein [Planctomycetota bacterium]
MSIATFGATVCLSPSPASAQAQQKRPNASQRDARSKQGGSDRRAPEKTGGRVLLDVGSLEEVFPPMPGPNPFRLRPEDRADLAPGEDEALLAFTRAKVPKLHLRLNQLRRREPGEFRQRLTEAAPRLRMLRRLFDESPEIAAQVVQHIDAVDTIKRAGRLWAERTSTADRRARIENDVRRRLAELSSIEQQLAQLRVADLVARRDEILDQEVARLVDPQTDLAGEADEVVEFVEAARLARTDSAKAGARTDLRDLLWVLLDEQIDTLNERAQYLEHNRETIVTRRMDVFLRRVRGAEPPNAAPPNAAPPTIRP